ncbi:MAG TPA: amidase family protein [Xanthobacteraceae bacterium]|nr:amidase family protein [Xanthobacteraceae bacterium]
MEARAVVARLRSGELTPHDLLDALQQRIARVDPTVNALPTLCFERARAQADRLVARPPAERGPLAGLPVPIKDLTDVAGVRTTYGSPIFADHVPEKSNILVERLEANGGIVYAKSNTPEFGAGANTFNEVFGATRNPWNTSRSAAGSSGGAAVALATGMAWVAHGSDMGGSLRNPASFCGVVGLRPSVGRVAKTPGAQIDGTLSVEGPMARDVEDLALLLDAMSGEHPADPLSLPSPPTCFQEAVRSGWKPRRVAYSPDLGITPVDPQVRAVTRAAAERLSREGIAVEEAHPDFSEAHECFQTLRALSFAVSRVKLLRHHRDLLKPEVVWNIEKGLALTAEEIARAQAQRVTLMQRALAFFERYDLLLCPATIVTAFPVGDRYLAACDGHTFETYIDWLAIVYAITLVCCPALSLPCGFDGEKLPVGLQIVAPPRAEARLLAGAKLIEDLLGLRGMTPIEPRARPA